nr:MAG TPA: hypothetical protein [Bacteriophage sp.]
MIPYGIINSLLKNLTALPSIDNVYTGYLPFRKT